MNKKRLHLHFFDLPELALEKILHYIPNAYPYRVISKEFKNLLDSWGPKEEVNLRLLSEQQLVWLLDHEYVPLGKVLEAAVQARYIRIIQDHYDQLNLDERFSIIKLSLKHDHVDFVDWMINHRIRNKTKNLDCILEQACSYNSYRIAHYIISNFETLHYDGNLLKLIAKLNHFPLFEKAYKNAFASSYCHGNSYSLDLLKHPGILTSAILRSNRAMIDFAITNGFSWTPIHTDTLLINGKKDLVEWVLEKNYITLEDIRSNLCSSHLSNAARWGYTDFIEYVLDQRFPANFSNMKSYLARLHPRKYLELLLKGKLDWNTDLSLYPSKTDLETWQDLVRTAHFQGHPVWSESVIARWIQERLETLVLFALENGMSLKTIAFYVYKHNAMDIYKSLITHGIPKMSNGEEIMFLLNYIGGHSYRTSAFIDFIFQMIEDGWRIPPIFVQVLIRTKGQFLTPKHMSWLLQRNNMLLLIDKNMFLVMMAFNLNESCIEWGLVNGFQWHPETTVTLVQYEFVFCSKPLERLQLVLKYGCKWHPDTTLHIKTNKLMLDVLKLGCPLALSLNS